MRVTNTIIVFMFFIYLLAIMLLVWIEPEKITNADILKFCVMQYLATTAENRLLERNRLE